VLNGLDLFSGIGGITEGLKRWVRPVIYCENERYAQGVLLSRMEKGDLPIAPIWDDVTTLDGKQFKGKIDIIYGGFPCQDISIAGHGKGLEGERSGLFFEIMRLVDEIRPQFIFLENVPAINFRGLGTATKEITERRYDSRWAVISASQIGALHQRKRWFLLAYANGEFYNGSKGGGVRPKRCKPVRPNVRSLGTIKHFRAWAVEPNVGRVVDGLPRRLDRIKCLGNAVVPRQVEIAFEYLLKGSL